MSTLKYSVVIPTYNNLEECLKPCIESVIRNSDLAETEIVVVANGCTDGTRDYVRSLGNQVRLIWFNEALGYTKSANIGIQQCNADLIVMLNNDASILDWGKSAWLHTLAAPFADPTTAVAGPSRLWYCPLTQTTNARNGNVVGEWFVLFFCAMISRRAIDKLGLLDEIFSPGYGEDIDFCFRAMKEGMKVVQVPDQQDEWSYNVNFPIYHAAGKSFGERGNTLFPKAMKIITERWNSGFYGPR